MNLAEFNKLKEIAKQDCEVSDDIISITKQNNNLPSVIYRWQTLVAKQRWYVKSLQIDLNELHSVLTTQYKLKDDILWTTAKELDTRINRDQSYIDKKRELLEQEWYLEFLEGVLFNVKEMRWTIRNYMEYYKTVNTNF